MAIFDDLTLDELKGFRKDLSEALVSGAMIVRFADRSVEYTSVADQQRAMNLLDSAITKLQGGSIKPNRVRIATRSGWR
jgi:hypothetical protein